MFRLPLLIFLICSLSLSAQNISPDHSFAVGISGINNNSSVKATVIQPDGKIIIGGDFHYYNGVFCKSLVRLNTDGSIDTSFEVATESNWPVGDVYAIALQSDGKIIVGGDFQGYNGYDRLMRFNIDGTVDYTFNTQNSVADRVYSIVIMPDDKIVIGGGLTCEGGQQYCNNTLKRFNSDGSADNTFNPGFGANGWIYVIKPESDGQLIIGGDFPHYNGISITRMARINTDGSLDQTFNPPVNTGIVYDIEVLADNSYIVAGDISSTRGIFKLDENGNEDMSFTGDFGEIGRSLLEDNGMFYVGGVNRQNITDSPTFIKRLYSNGQSDPVFDTISLVTNGYMATLNNLIKQPDGKILMSGMFTSYEGISKSGIARLNNCSASPNTLQTVVTTDSTYTWSENGTTYDSTGIYYYTLTNINGCDSLIELNLTFIDYSAAVFSIPSDNNECTGSVVAYITGIAPFDVTLDGNPLDALSPDYYAGDSICPGIHNMQVVDSQNDTLNQIVVVASELTSILNDPFNNGQIILDSLSFVYETCDIDYASIDTAYIDTFTFIGADTVIVTWNVIDSAGIHTINSTYFLQEGPGNYYLQLQLYCPQRSTDQLFLVTEGIVYDGEDLSTLGVEKNTPEKFALFPNPTNDGITIHSEGAIVSMKIYDSQGKFLDEQTYANNAFYSMSHLTSGIYLIELFNGTQRSIHRVILN